MVFPCPLCTAPFAPSGDNAPHLLACGHSLCRACAVDHIRATLQRLCDSGVLSFGDSVDHIAIPCPLCRAETLINTAGESEDDCLPPLNTALIHSLLNPEEDLEAFPEPPKTEVTYPVLEEPPAESMPRTNLYPTIEEPVDDAPPAVPPRPAVPQRMNVRVDQFRKMFTAVKMGTLAESPKKMFKAWKKKVNFATSNFRETASLVEDFKPVLVPFYRFTVTFEAKLKGVESSFGSNLGTSFEEQFSVREKRVMICCSTDERLRKFVLENFLKAWDKAPVAIYNGVEEQKSTGLFSKLANIFAVKGPVHSTIADFPAETVVQREQTVEESYKYVKKLAKRYFEGKADTAVTMKVFKKVTDKKVKVSSGSYDCQLVYVPMHVARYTCDGAKSDYLVVINGESGDIEGERPFSTIATGIRAFLSPIIDKELTLGDFL